MDKEKILKKLEELIRDVLDLETLSLMINSSIDNINGWDSLNHINIIIQIEKEFNIKFSLEEISELSSISKIIDAIDKKK